MGRRNIAYEHLTVAEEAFLRARGWVQTGYDSWVEPRSKEDSEPRTLNFGHAVNSEMIYSSRAEVGPDEPPRMKEPDLEDIKLRASQEIYLRERDWHTIAKNEHGNHVNDPDGTLYRRSKKYLSFKEALDQSKFHDRKHGAHRAVKMPPQQPFANELEAAAYTRNMHRHAANIGPRIVTLMVERGFLGREDDPVDVLKSILDTLDELEGTPDKSL